MRVAFLIKRKNYYRPLGPIVEEALRRGYQVECWHDFGHARTGWKGSEFPDAVPEFRSGAPTVVRFEGLPELTERFHVDPPDAVICVDPPEPDVVPVTKARWFWIQYAADLVLHPAAPQGIMDATAVGMFSPWWVTQLRRNFGADLIEGGAQRKMVTVGMPELDVARAIDPDKVRWIYGLPRSQPLVLYLPFPLKSFPPRFWLRNVFRPSSRLRQGVMTLLGPRRGFTGRRLDYWPHVRNGWNDRRLVESLKAFCDRNGAALVMKSREKDPIPGYARAKARARFDEFSHYPPTILELLRCASLCIHFYSTAVLESVSCSVPSLCLGPAARDMGLDEFNGELVHNGTPGGIYNWPGAAHWKPLHEAFDGFRAWGLDDFPLEPESRRRYVEQFLGFDDGRSAARFLDLLEHPAEGGGQGRRTMREAP